MIVNATTMDANFVSNNILEDEFGYIHLNWIISNDFVQDGEYEITVKVICDKVWGSPDEVRLSSVNGVIEQTYPQRYGTSLPIETEVHIGQELSLAFTKPLLCFPIPFDIQISVGRNLTLFNDQLLINCHENIIGFVIDLTKVPLRNLVGQTFAVEIGHIYTETAFIKDIHGNPTGPNKGNIRFEKTFLPLGQDMQTSFTFSLSSLAAPTSSLCSVCGSSIPTMNCTTSEMRRYQESVIRNQLTSMMSLDATDRIGVASINCISNTISGTVTFTDPPKPTTTSTLYPSSSMKPVHKPTKRPSTRRTLKLTRSPSTKLSVTPTVNPTVKLLDPTTTGPTFRPTINPTIMPTRLLLQSKGGLIYNMASGQCLSFSGGTVQVTTCDDRKAFSQSWFSAKKLSNAFILQSNSSHCLDGGDLNEGSRVILNVCMDGAASQVWTYDDSHHLQLFNRNLCATIFN